MFRNQITETLIATNFIVFLLSIIFPSIFINFVLIPAKVLNGEIWRLITSMFLHGGIGHIIMNMLALYFFGNILEAQLGRTKFFTAYFIGGIVAGLIFILFSFPPLSFIPTLGSSLNANAIGASGAIFAIGTLLALLAPNLRVGFLFLPIQTTLFYSIILWFVILTIFSLSSGHIANSAHLGGILGGIIMAKFLGDKRTVYV